MYNSSYQLETIKVYEDGLIGCWGLVDLDGFKQNVPQGQVVTQVPAGQEISCHHLFYGPSTLRCYVEIDEFVKEVEDTILELQEKPTSSDLCREAFQAYIGEPTTAHQQVLQAAYERVPKHLRVYLLHDMDMKDRPIKHILSAHPVDDDILADYRRWYVEEAD